MRILKYFGYFVLTLAFVSLILCVVDIWFIDIPYINSNVLGLIIFLCSIASVGHGLYQLKRMEG